MPITVTCPYCEKVYTLRDEFAGKTAACTCGKEIEVPTELDLPVAEIVVPGAELAPEVKPEPHLPPAAGARPCPLCEESTIEGVLDYCGACGARLAAAREALAPDGGGGAGGRTGPWGRKAVAWLVVNGTLLLAVIAIALGEWTRLCVALAAIALAAGAFFVASRVAAAHEADERERALAEARRAAFANELPGRIWLDPVWAREELCRAAGGASLCYVVRRLGTGRYLHHLSLAAPERPPEARGEMFLRLVAALARERPEADPGPADAITVERGQSDVLHHLFLLSAEEHAALARRVTGGRAG